MLDPQLGGDMGRVGAGTGHQRVRVAEGDTTFTRTPDAAAFSASPRENALSAAFATR